MSSTRSNTRSCKLLIIGAYGLVGSSAFYQAAKLEADMPSSAPGLFASPQIIAIDQFKPGHAQGSSHGESRITRLAIGEGAEYVALAQKSHEIWKDIEAKTNYEYGFLLNLPRGGGLIVGPHPEVEQADYHGAKGFLSKTIERAQEARIGYQCLDNDVLRAAYPQFKFREEDVGYCEHTMGYINPDACIKANLSLARKYRGELRDNEKVERFVQEGNKVRVITSKDGEELHYLTDKLIVAAGPWVNNLVKTEELKVYRETVFWFKLDAQRADSYNRNVFPTFIWNINSDKMVYGFPFMDEDERVIKVGSESYSTITTPETANRIVTQLEITAFYETMIKPYFKGITSECVRSQTCLYTVAPNWRFVIDHLPEFGDKVIVASPCSGHGAKHAAAIGLSLAQQSLLGRSDIPVIELFGGLLSKAPQPAARMTATP
jgi:sarcosine oxidase